jgi:AcrR family transcriptional regulator
VDVPLPIATADGGLTERADAARNRRRILCAAERLFAERGAYAVSMDDVAREAGVGVGTLYRRFTDRAGLQLALLSERERLFQDELLHGAPPLGPGAPARERLHAFGARYLQFLDEHAELLNDAFASRPTMRFGGPYALYRTHLLVLVREAAPDVDSEYATESLFSALLPRLYLHLRDDRGWPLERVLAGWCQLVDAWVGSQPPELHAVAGGANGATGVA